MKRLLVSFLCLSVAALTAFGQAHSPVRDGAYRLSTGLELRDRQAGDDGRSHCAGARRLSLRRHLCQPYS